MKPLIGVSTSATGGWRSYLAISFAIWRAGGRSRRITPKTGYSITELDGVIAGGGDDISASVYGGELLPNVRLDPERDALETELIPEAVRLEIPVLGICRGAQLINVSLGGTLHTDIWEVFENAPKLRTVLPRKEIRVAADAWLSSVLQTRKCRVNALHHQSIKETGRSLRVSALDDHEIVQAIETRSGKPVLGVQWHPELMPFSKTQQRLFQWLVEAAKNRKDTGEYFELAA
ncbi:gamma-glutamyl-gamma-aminobutyrate hydrolase family protein [Roseibium alexandrii]